MKLLDGHNEKKIYDLSAGRSIPVWVNKKQRKKILTESEKDKKSVEILEDFTMPDVSRVIRETNDSESILVAGLYKPRLKCFDTKNHCLKFERCLDREVIDMYPLSDDYTKIVFLQDDRYLEFHDKGGKCKNTIEFRIPKFGTRLAYHHPACDLYISSEGPEIYKINLETGWFLPPIKTDATANNTCVLNPIHYLLTTGTVDGHVEAWDTRSNKKSGSLDVAKYLSAEQNELLVEYNTVKDLEIRSLAFKGINTLGVGTQTGHVLLYDIRSNKPFTTYSHDGLPIKSVQFHSSGKVLSMSSDCLKIRDQQTGESHTTIDSNYNLQDLCVIQNSGMIFLALDHPKLKSYFLPSLGPAPKWCAHLDALIEELEGVEVSNYDDYRYIDEKELEELHLKHLKEGLEPSGKGYFILTSIYNKRKQLCLERKKHKEMIQERKKMQKEQILPTDDNIKNKQVYTEVLLVNKDSISDPRFSQFYLDPKCEISKTDREYMAVRRRKVNESESESEEEMETTTS